ncbi:hypothetical protein Afil01_64820 [Actinorhabdospora filicis]|uniref:Uncharacterized protein n=1 Tax=Actinorhabdospora filicis TaxID=1785913 RepID=A0A9W6STI2_9ACTN|nr:hypothetical protein [Actinorhabdospora filicis]GLZ81675.1 hypothetical protein Afil01_64820 [Actinorhabdospora filicis]
MGNTFTARGTTAVPDALSLSNGGTDAFFDVLMPAACDLAATPWELRLAVLLVDSGHRHLGVWEGFDLAELPWTGGWPHEKAFLLRVIDLAATGHGRDRLGYEPPFAAGYLADYRAMAAGFTPVPAVGTGWDAPPDPRHVERCREHGLFHGSYGCPWDGRPAWRVPTPPLC